MKKLLAIVVLCLLVGCSSNNYESYVKRSAKNNTYTAKAQSISSGAWHGGSSTNSSEGAAIDAIFKCNKRFNKSDCVLHSIGTRYVFEESKQDYKIQIAKNVCIKVGYAEGTEAFSDCTVKMLTKAEQQKTTVIVGGGYKSPYKPSCTLMGTC